METVPDLRLRPMWLGVLDVTDGGKTPELNGSADAELCALLVGEVAKAYLEDARTMEMEQKAGN